ncbi:hypothetical protein [Streptomyces sp. NPDC001743]|uniref:hypothetical protein n=1 Tax=Streptomyces sp. NPDC001743 TaxID=3154397 RepID=UPI00331D92CB
MAATVVAAAAMVGALAPTMAAADPLSVDGGYLVTAVASDAGERIVAPGKSDPAERGGASWTAPGGRLPDTGSRGGEWVIGGIGAALLIAGTVATLVARRARRRG